MMSSNCQTKLDDFWMVKKSANDTPGSSKSDVIGRKRKCSLQENNATKRPKLANEITNDPLPHMSIFKLHSDKLGLRNGMSVDELRKTLESKFGKDNSVYEPIFFESFQILVFEYGSIPGENKVRIPFKNIKTKKRQVKNKEQKTSGTLVICLRELKDEPPEIFCLTRGTGYKKVINLADNSFRTKIAKSCLDQNYLRRVNYVTVSGPYKTVRCVSSTVGMFDNSLDVLERVYTELEGQIIQDCEVHQIISKNGKQGKKFNIEIGQYKVKMLFGLNLTQFSQILKNFSDIFRSDISTTDNLSCLDLVKKEDDRDKIKNLNKGLLKIFIHSIKDYENSHDLSLSHNHIDDWVLSSEISLILREEQKCIWYSTPSLEDVKRELNNISRNGTRLTEEIEKKKIKIKFQNKNENDYDCEPLQVFLHGTIPEDSGEIFYKIGGKWYMFTVKYSEQIELKYNKLVNKLTYENKKVLRLLLPWSNDPQLRIEDLGNFFKLPDEKAEKLMLLFKRQIAFIGKRTNISLLKKYHCWLVESSKVFQSLKKKGCFKLDQRENQSKKFIVEQIISESNKRKQDLTIVQKGKKMNYLHKIYGEKTFLVTKNDGDYFWKVVNPNVPTHVLKRIKTEIPELKDISSDQLALFFRSFSKLTENEYNSNYFMHDVYKPDVTTLYGDRVLVKNVELFDVLIHAHKTTYLLHVKQGFGNTTRDACSQIRISSQLIWNSRSDYRSCNSYINRFWKTAIKYEKIDGRRQMLKKKLKEIGKETFFSFFNKDIQIVFVLAFMDKSKNKLSSTKSTIAKMELLYLNHYFNNYVSDDGYKFQLQVCQIPSTFDEIKTNSDQ